MRRGRTLVFVLMCLAEICHAKKSGGKKKQSHMTKDRSFEKDYHCKFNLEAYRPKEKVSYYFCDKTAKLLNAVSKIGGSGSEWVDATPKRNSGCHEYAAHAGPPPEGCKVGKSCEACAKPKGKHLTSVHFANNGDKGCAGCGPEVRRRTPNSGPIPNVEEDFDDDEDAELWGVKPLKPKAGKKGKAGKASKMGATVKGTNGRVRNFEVDFNDGKADLGKIEL
jgi:hypothetical protein